MISRELRQFSLVKYYKRRHCGCPSATRKRRRRVVDNSAELDINHFLMP